MRHLAYKLLITLLSLTTPLLALGALDGTLGTGKGGASSGSLHVSLEITPLVLISRLNDISMRYDPKTRTAEGSSSLCVYRNFAGLYSVTVKSSNGFTLRNANNSTVPYAVSWNGLNLPEGVSSGPIRANIDANSLDCAGRDNVSLRIHSSAQQLAKASTVGSHSDTIVITVAIE